MTQLMPEALLSEPPPRGHPASILAIGNLLYLLSVGLVALLIIGVFFGAGFLLLMQPGSMLSSAGPRHAVSQLKSPLSTAFSLSNSPDGPADGGTRLLAAPTLKPGLGEATASLVTPLTPPPTVGEKPAPEANDVAQSSAALPAATAAKELQAGLPSKAASSAAGHPPTAPDPAQNPPTAPALAPPDPRLSAAEITELLDHGDALLRTGDVASARLFYERAATAGDGRGALRLAATFDPAFLGRAGLRSVQGNPAEARSWYSRALDLGAAEAKRQLNTLATKQGR
jgi:hypothetical protein